MNTKLDFSDFSSVFETYPQLESVSFVQGMLIGQVSAQPSLSEAQWIKSLVKEAEMGPIKESTLMLLHQLHLTTLQGLNSQDMDLQLVLPQDNAELAERVKHLADWCEGFLYGMGLGHLDQNVKLPAEVREVLQDFAEVSMLAIPEQVDEASEGDYIELCEFVRMGALMVFDELNPVTQSPIAMPDQDSKPTLH